MTPNQISTFSIYIGIKAFFWPCTKQYQLILTQYLFHSKSKALQLIWWVTHIILGLVLILIVNPVLKEMGLNQAIQSQILFRGKQPNKKGISYTLGWFISAPALASIVLFSLLNWKLDLWESKVICGYYIFVFSGLVFEYLRLICICVFSSLVFIWPAFVYFYVKYLCGLDFEMAEQTKRRVATGADFGPWALSYLLHLFVLLLFSIFSLNNITGALRLFPTQFLSFHFYCYLIQRQLCLYMSCITIPSQRSLGSTSLSNIVLVPL